MLLNRGHELLGMYLVSVGEVDSTIVDTRLVFQPSILANAEAIILSHNHPTGKLKPSAEDNRMTDKLKKAGEILGVKVIDHIILRKEGFYSMIQE
jgi:DNA repair protein RadC